MEILCLLRLEGLHDKPDEDDKPDEAPSWNLFYTTLIPHSQKPRHIALERQSYTPCYEFTLTNPPSP